MALTAGWHEYFLLAGTAAATLTGLMFVAISITASFTSDDSLPGLSTFLSPTIFHLASIVVLCLLVLLPTDALAFGILVLVAGCLGLAYAVNVARRVERFFLDPEGHIDAEDRLYYGRMPVVAHFIVAAAGVLILLHVAGAMWAVAFAAGALLLLSIRNAWDITVWATVRAPNAPH